MGVVPPRLPPETLKTLVLQDGVIAAWQMSASLRRAAGRAVRLGQWQRLTTQTFLTSPAEATQNQLLWAACLHGGPQAMLTGRAALVLHGWRQPHRKPFDVISPAEVHREVRPSWLRVHRFRKAPCKAVGTPRRVNDHVAAAHAASWARSDREALFLVISALQERVIEAERLIRVVDSHPSIRRRQLITESAIEYSKGIQSVNEWDFADLCRRHGLPEPLRQTRQYDSQGRCHRVDVEFRSESGRTVLVEVEGLQHLDPENWD